MHLKQFNFERNRERIIRYIKGDTKFIFDEISYRLKQKSSEDTNIASNSKTIILFDTSINTDNQGDLIIRHYCVKELEQLGLKINKCISTHKYPSEEETEWLKKSNLKIITGTNILSPRLNFSSIWKRPENLEYTENLCLFGCGMLNYSRNMNEYSK